MLNDHLRQSFQKTNHCAGCLSITPVPTSSCAQDLFSQVAGYDLMCTKPPLGGRVLHGCLGPPETSQLSTDGWRSFWIIFPKNLIWSFPKYIPKSLSDIFKAATCRFLVICHLSQVSCKNLCQAYGAHCLHQFSLCRLLIARRPLALRQPHQQRWHPLPWPHSPQICAISQAWRRSSFHGLHGLKLVRAKTWEVRHCA